MIIFPAKKQNSKKILVTAALPYVNNVPHLGNLIPTLSADVFARYCRLKGENTIFVCGTDEHGTTTETKAIEEGITPKEICDKYFKIHKEIYEWFNCSFDCFGRTSYKENKEITIDIFKKLDKNNFIVADKIEQLYCKKCDKFLADRFVEGSCPKCGYEEARGDQCEKCGSLLNATELLNPRCKVCGESPEVVETEHLFIDLKKIEPDLLKWMKKVEKNWSLNAQTLTKAWIKEGLKLRCITRDLKWGIKVPKQGFTNKVFYSWFDAPIGYIGITAHHKKDWKKWWLSPKDTKLVQFMGKDNIPFHTILFPSFLIGTKDNYTLMSEISVNEYLNYESGMFSKSRNIGVFGDSAMQTGISSDVWRYYLMINRPETNDYQFTWDDFQQRINSELVANLGNLVNRTITFIHKFFDSKIPYAELNAKDKKLQQKLEKEFDKLDKMFEKQQLRDAFKQIFHISRLGNQYFQEEEPWKKIKEDKERAGTSLFVLANLCNDLSVVIDPFLPDASKSIQQAFKMKDLDWSTIGNNDLHADTKIGRIEVLFKKVDDKEKNRYKEKFAGQEAKPDKVEFPLDLKVAKIMDVKDHPEADKLLIMQIDIGEKRQIVAGIKRWYKPEELMGKNIVIVANLKPAVLRGEKSQGMLLAADDGKNVKLLEAPGSVPGDKVTIEGAKPKKEISYDEFAKVEMKTKDNKVKVFGQFLATDKEDISVDIKDGCSIK